MTDKSYSFPDDMKSLGILGYMIVINKQVHSYQIDALTDYLSNIGIDIDNSVLKDIIDGSDNAICLDECLLSFWSEKLVVQVDIVYMICLLSQLDNVIDEKEKKYISRIIDGSKLNEIQKQNVILHARNNASIYRKTNNRLFENSIHTLNAKINDNRTGLRKKFGRRKSQSEELITDEEYIRIISKCSEVAREDYSIVHPCYFRIIQNNKIVLDQISRIGLDQNVGNELSTEVNKLVDEFSNAVKEKIVQQTVVAEELLAQKERTLPDFTISLLGRTKAGKSTLHAILTKQGYEKIGFGKQRTTRYNRVYQWNMLRIIDTPGIGSAESSGRIDDEIAQSVLGESDIICLVVVDDSILQDTLELMDRISTYNKPIVILLNHKENIRNEVKYKYFKSKPDKWLKATKNNNSKTCSKSEIDGHIVRITNYAANHGYDKLVKVFPVFLLAARMSHEKEYQKDAKLLWEYSNISPFITYLRNSVVRSGTIKRSQTIIDEAVQTLVDLSQQLDRALQPIDRHINFLEKSQRKILRELKQCRDLTVRHVKDIIVDKGRVLADEKAKTFAREAFEDFKEVDRKDVSLKWNKYIADSGIKEELAEEVDAELERFKSLADERVKEMLDDIYYNIRIEFDIPQMGIPLAINFKRIMRICNTISLSELAVLSVLSIFFKPLMIVGALVFVRSVVFCIGGLLAKPRKIKEELAIKRLQKAISREIKKITKEQAMKGKKVVGDELDRQIDNIDRIFNELISGLRILSSQGHNMQSEYQNNIKWLNKVYAWRIVQYLNGTDEKYSTETVNEKVKAVYRDNNTIYIGTEKKYHSDSKSLDGVIADNITFV